jgi:hypothetical protein
MLEPFHLRQDKGTDDGIGILDLVSETKQGQPAHSLLLSWLGRGIAATTQREPTATDDVS